MNEVSRSEQPYPLPDLRPPLRLYYPPAEREFTFKRVLLHLSLFMATGVTTAVAGVVLPLALTDSLAWDDAATTAGQLLATPVGGGVAFAFTLLAILGTHELGHYFACRYYRVRATLPYFIPFLPILGIGTLGAFIRIKSPITSRRALFDIGIAGPIAGFVLAVPAAVVGLLAAAPETATPLIVFNDPLLFVWIKQAFGLAPQVQWHPIWFAAWVGMIATSLNLLPVGQLDGGHIIYAIFGRRGHRLIGLSVYALAIGVAALGWVYHSWAGGLVYVALLTLMLFAKHPPTGEPGEKLGAGRIAVAVAGALIFLLSAMPFPMSIN